MNECISKSINVIYIINPINLYAKFKKKEEEEKQQHKHTQKKHLKYLYVMLFALIYVLFYFKKN